VKLTTHLSAEVKNVRSYSSTPSIRLNGVVLRKSTGTTLPLPFTSGISFKRNKYFANLQTEFGNIKVLYKTSPSIATARELVKN
jgi:hypothetical protein